MSEQFFISTIKLYKKYSIKQNFLIESPAFWTKYG